MTKLPPEAEVTGILPPRKHRSSSRRTHVLPSLPIGTILTLFGFLSCPAWGVGAEEVIQPVKIGVLAERGTERCVEKWGPTAEYLTKRIPGYSFSIVPLAYAEILPAAGREEVDFFLVNPSIYVELEVLHGADRIATLKNRHLDGTVYTVYGGVVFCRADRKDIQDLQDLKGRTFMAPDERSLGGWPRRGET